MTKKEYIKLAMRLRPSAKDWRELVEKAIRSGCIDYESATNYKEVYPLAIAIVHRLTDWWENGSMSDETRRYTRREVKNIKCFI